MATRSVPAKKAWDKRWHSMYTINHHDWTSELSSQLADAPVLQQWPLSFDGTWTYWQRCHGQEWLTSPQIGGIQFALAQPQINAYPRPDISREVFDSILHRDWLPAIYPHWGTQVLHASAAYHIQSGRAIAFAGESGSGKSTLGYALAQRPGWQQIADDNLAFVTHPELKLMPIHDAARLRPHSAAYFDVSQHPMQTLSWPEQTLILTHVFFLEPSLQDGIELDLLGKSACYIELLKQAYTLTNEDSPQFLRDYLQLTHKIRGCRLRFKQSLDNLNPILDLIEVQSR